MAYYDAITFAAWRYAAASGVPRMYWHCSLATVPPSAAAARAVVTAWLPTGQGGLLLYGRPGTGKTGLAVAALWAAWGEHARPGRFAHVATLLDACRAYAGDPHGPDPLDALRRTPLLILDDLGAQRLTDFGEERLYVLLHARHAEGRGTLVTSNLTPTRLAGLLSERLAWRLQALCTPVPVGG